MAQVRSEREREKRSLFSRNGMKREKKSWKRKEEEIEEGLEEVDTKVVCV